MREKEKRSGSEQRMYSCASIVISWSWPRKTRILDMLSQSAESGSEQQSRKRTERYRVRPSRRGWLAPNAWEQSGSMPSESPDSTE
uniref:Uncharacterized protein n=1 Tax=Arundo donax TaxID=35708 RepID=A0A0A8XRP3_ARUDO